jgi:protein TonB
MKDQVLLSSLGASLLIHTLLIVAVASMIRAKGFMPVLIPVGLVETPRVEETKHPEVVPIIPAPAPQDKPKNIIAPKLLSKPEAINPSRLQQATNMKEEPKEPEEIVAPLPAPASLPPEPSSPTGGGGQESKPGQGEGFLQDTSGGTGALPMGSQAEPNEPRASAAGSGESLSGFTRPLSGYQVKPRYPESARRARAQGTTVLKLRVLENGRVGEIQIEKSAGHRELDVAAAEAVKKWVFEPARDGKTNVAVWVLVPVKFELQ